MGKWNQLLLTVAALIFALSFAVWAVKPRAEPQSNYQLMDSDGFCIFDTRTGTIYTRIRKPNLDYWKPEATMPPADR